MVLAISRVIGETAPLLVVAGATDGMNFDLFDGRMTTLPGLHLLAVRPVHPGRLNERAWGVRWC